MKKQLSILAALIAAGSCAAPAFAVEHYVSANAGISWMNDINIPLLDANARLKTGYALTGAVGADYGSYRFEAELGYADYNLKRIDGTLLNGDISFYSLMANACYDFNAGNRVTPYLLAGVGIAQGSMNNMRYTGSIAPSITEHETTLAYQIGVGVAIPISDSVDLDAKYRYFATTDFSTNFGNLNVDSNSLLLGLRVKF